MIHNDEFPPKDGKLRTAIQNPTSKFIDKLDIPQRNIYLFRKEGARWIVFDTLYYIFKRGDKFLNVRYEWVDMPDGFEEYRKDNLEVFLAAWVIHLPIMHW